MRLQQLQLGRIRHCIVTNRNMDRAHTQRVRQLDLRPRAIHTDNRLYTLGLQYSKLLPRIRPGTTIQARRKLIHIFQAARVPQPHQTRRQLRTRTWLQPTTMHSSNDTYGLKHRLMRCESGGVRRP